MNATPDKPSEPDQPAGPAPVQLVHPGWLIPVTIIAGLPVSGPMAGAILHQCGQRLKGWFLGAIAGVTGMLLILLSFLQNMEWYWVALGLFGIHILAGSLLFFIIRGTYHRCRPSGDDHSRLRGGYRETIAGVIGGMFLAGLLGFLSAAVYVFLTDKLFSTVMPAAFEDNYAGMRVFLIGFFFVTAAGMATGGFIGRFRPALRVPGMIICALALIWSYFTWLFMVELVVCVPGFQAGAATGAGWDNITSLPIILSILIGIWWAAGMVFYVTSRYELRPGLWRGIQVFGFNVAAAITVCIYSGHVADIYLGFGHVLERSANIDGALWCYERGLKKNPEKQIASYLQYRVALMYHKLGERDLAESAFSRLIAKYTSNYELVKKANQFIENMKRSRDGRRAVLPGVETRTEYRDSYCVPNSLALVMRYWGDDTTAREIGRQITRTGVGTIIVDQMWFAAQNGFRHDFLPMAAIEDIKSCIDAGLPVLVYVPRHVLVIVGYDESLGTLVTYDVSMANVWSEYIQKDFIKSWKKQHTTLVLAYPPDKEQDIPLDIRGRLLRLSENYLHYHLHYLDRPKNSLSIPHLMKAAGDTGEFFFPVMVLYSQFPELRPMIREKFSSRQMANSIQAYFGSDFDEGVHGASQYHDDRSSTRDRDLKMSIRYLVDLGELALVEKVISRIDRHGQVSDDMIAELGMIDLSQGNLERGIDRLERAGQDAFYAALANLRMGNRQAGIRDLSRAIKGIADSFPYQSGFYDRKKRGYLDLYGFPVMAVANQIISGMDSFGESSETIEESLEKWLGAMPFDGQLAGALSRLYRQRLNLLDREENASEFERLDRKLQASERRASRYAH